MLKPRIPLIACLALGLTALDPFSLLAKDVVERSFFSGTIRANFPAKANHAMKGVVVTVGDAQDAYVCYDTDLLRVSLAWTGEFLNFGNGQREIVHPPPPEVAGAPVFGTSPGPVWAKGEDFTDPRPNRQGPLPADWAKYRGLFVHGEQVVLSYTVGGVAVRELPGLETHDGTRVFTRTFQIAPSSTPLTLLVAELPGASGGVSSAGDTIGSAPSGTASGSVAALQTASGSFVAANARGAVPPDTTWQVVDGRIHLKIPAHPQAATIQVAVTAGPIAEFGKAATALRSPAPKLPDVDALTHGGPARWTPVVTTRGVRAPDNAAYVVDILTEPTNNPWKAKTFLSGFDFFADGRAAVCAFHGDVWIVSGLDDGLETLTWKRFATGLFQPLGLKIVNETLYVLGRDQITRLRDLNGDGEADAYDNFNNDTVVTPNYHEFCLDLQADADGNFYYAKGSPWPSNVETPHQGTLLKVSADGAKLEVFATGLRAPNGLGLGPRGELTVSDNQGHWMPSSKLNLIKAGGFYGMMPAAHRSPLPKDFDPPICWLPMKADNSSGGQVWVTSEKWGPLKDHMLFMSYGRGTLFHVMLDQVEGVTQAAMARFPFKFPTGVMRGRCHPRDGQIYVCGLRGWQTDGTRDGGFYRVRYTGQPARMAQSWRVVPDGLRLTFTDRLDATSAADAENYSLEQWNYLWSGEYGSPEFSAKDPARKGHDTMEIKSARLESDGQTVTLEIPGLQPVHQLRLQCRLKTAAGASLEQEIYGTIHRVPQRDR